MPRRFRDRREAGRALASALACALGAARRRDGVVVALARGGVLVADEVARELGMPLDVLAVRKVGHPLQPEYAIGAVAPGGDGVYVRASDGLTEAEIVAAVERALAASEELNRRLHERRAPVDVEGREVVLVDDGLATGATMVAAIRWARGRGARRVVAAVPVAAAQSAALIRSEADEFVCPVELEQYGSVGFSYEQFTQVGNDEVIRILGEAAARAPGPSPGDGASSL